MKRLIILVCVYCISLSLAAQTSDIFKISYQIYIDESIKNIDPETEKDEVKKELASTALMLSIFQAEGQSLADAWVNNEFIRVKSNILNSSYQITNKKDLQSFLVSPETEEYSEVPVISDKFVNIEDNSFSLSELPVEFISGQEKVIAGYNCKLAKINISDDDKNMFIAVWYTDKLPTLYWGEYAYLEKIPGASLRIETMGLGIEAFEVKKVEPADSLFEIPSHYTLQEYPTLEDEESNDFELFENRIAYYDSTLYMYGVKDSLDNIILEPSFTSLHGYSNGIITGMDSTYNSGAMDLNGEILIPFQFEGLTYDEVSNTYVYMENGLFGFLNDKGEVILPAKYEALGFLRDGYATFTKDSKGGIINKDGKVIVSPSHDYILENRADVFLTMTDNDKYTLFNITTGKKIIGDLDYLAYAGEKDIYITLKNEKFQYIRSNGRPLSTQLFTYAGAFENGVAEVLIGEDEDVKHINLDGQIVN